MKRSEVLDLIANHIQQEFCPMSEDGWDLSLCHAVTILDMIEDMGMKPTGYEGLIATGEKWIKEKHQGRDVTFFRGWEPE